MNKEKKPKIIFSKVNIFEIFFFLIPKSIYVPNSLLLLLNINLTV